MMRCWCGDRTESRFVPSNGYPVRLLLPGFEGNTSIKWLRRSS